MRLFRGFGKEAVEVLAVLDCIMGEYRCAARCVRPNGEITKKMTTVYGLKRRATYFATPFSYLIIFARAESSSFTPSSSTSIHPVAQPLATTLPVSDEIDFRSRENWWRDPLAAFEKNSDGSLLDSASDILLTSRSAAPGQEMAEGASDHHLSDVQDEILEIIQDEDVSVEGTRRGNDGPYEEWTHFTRDHQAGEGIQQRKSPLSTYGFHPPEGTKGFDLADEVESSTSAIARPVSFRKAVPGPSSRSDEPDENMIIPQELLETATDRSRFIFSKARGLLAIAGISNPFIVKVTLAFVSIRAVSAGIRNRRVQQPSPVDVDANLRPADDVDIDSGGHRVTNKEEVEKEAWSLYAEGKDLELAKTDAQPPSSGDDLKIVPRSLSFFGLGRRVEPLLQEALKDVHVLKQRYDGLHDEKTALEKAYETTSWQLKETSSELNSLRETNNFLQLKVKEQEKVQEIMIRTECEKATSELVRMKDAMVQLLKKERDKMKEEFIHQATELQSEWRRKFAPKDATRLVSKYLKEPTDDEAEHLGVLDEEDDEGLEITEDH